jgi:hypothetical protein
MRPHLLVAVLLLLLCVAPATASEQDALQISSIIQSRHLLEGIIFDPVYASADPVNPDFNSIVGYTHCRDSAIWTGHYLAAEAFRYSVTTDSIQKAEALNAVVGALGGTKFLLDVTRTEVLARCFINVTSPYAGFVRDEIVSSLGAENLFQSKVKGNTYYWAGRTSRDQYSGLFFGLAVAYDVVPNANVRDSIFDLVTRMLDYLLDNNWNVVMPDGRISTTFLHRPDQQLAFLQVGRRVNPKRFAAIYESYRLTKAGSVAAPIAADSADNHESYFKFNLNAINLYTLIRLEESSSAFRATYLNAYSIHWGTIKEHLNAHFDLIDHGIKGVSEKDWEIPLRLEDWLNTTVWVGKPARRDWPAQNEKYGPCGSKSSVVIPVSERPVTDFVWQRSPYMICGWGIGTVEVPGIDYILPYWMARHYGVL